MCVFLRTLSVLVQISFVLLQIFTDLSLWCAITCLANVIWLCALFLSIMEKTQSYNTNSRVLVVSLSRQELILIALCCVCSNLISYARILALQVKVTQKTKQFTVPKTSAIETNFLCFSSVTSVNRFTSKKMASTSRINIIVAHQNHSHEKLGKMNTEILGSIWTTWTTRQT